MPPLIQCRQLSHAAGGKPLFRQLDLTINEGSRIGLVGHNGSGKSTLLSLISGITAPDEGDISRRRGMKLEVVEQFLPDRLADLGLLAAVVQKLPADEADFLSYRAERLLEELGFTPAEFTYQVRDLSGGQQNRLMFARAVIEEPDLVLFDEPTNHLDLQTLMLLENWLKSRKMAYLVISHDREFLDNVTDQTVVLRDQRTYPFELSFSPAMAALQAHDEAAEARLRDEEKQIRHLTASAKRLATWGKVYDNEKLAAKAKTIERRVEKLEGQKTFVTRGSGLHLALDVNQSRANRMVQLEGCDIQAPGTGSTLFHIDDFYIRPGDRIALLGHNGVGKTTLIKWLMAEYRSPGADDHIRFNPQCEIGYYDQEIELLDPQLNLLETLRKACPRGDENDYKSALIRTGFPYRELDKQVKVLSGGEKARLMFLIIQLNTPNFLVLDEPTNHIDIQGKEDLERQIMNSNATVLLTSHDRRFVDNIATRFALIADGRLQSLDDPDDFYQRGRAAAPTEVSAEASTPATELDEDEALQRLVELEALLEADQQRKPKFQKPAQQARWQEEIDRLSRQLT